MLLDSFWLLAEGDIENFCRIDWDLIRQKWLSFFVQSVHSYQAFCGKSAECGLRIFFYVYGDGTDNGTGAGYVGFSYGLSVGLSYGRKETVDFLQELAYYSLSQTNVTRVHMEQNENPQSDRSGGFLARYGELSRLGCCCLFISVQPLAYVVANHTRCDRNNKCYNNIVHTELTSFLLEARQHIHHIIAFRRFPQLFRQNLSFA